MNVRSPNHRGRMKLLVVIGALALLVLVAALALPFIIDVNTYRGLIESKAEASLGRKVTLGRMSLSLVPTFGIKVDEPQIENLLHARSLIVGVRLMPLLFGGAIDVKKVVLNQPDIVATRTSDGRWSFEGLGGGQGAESTPGQAHPARPFSLARLIISQGKLHLRDEMRQGAPLVVDFDLDLDAAVKGSGAGDLNATFDGTLKGDRLLFDLRGSLDRGVPPGATAFDIIVDNAEVEIARAREIVTALGQGWPVSEGLVRSKSVKVGGRMQAAFSAAGLSSLVLTDLVVRDADVYLARDRKGRWNFDSLFEPNGASGVPTDSAQAPSIVVKNLRVGGGRVALHDESLGSGAPVDLSFKDLLLVIEEFDRKGPLGLQLQATLEPRGGSLEISGKLPLSASGPVDLIVDLKAFDAHALAPYLRSFTDLEAESGAVTAHMKVTGNYPKQVTASGTIALDEVKTASAQPITGKADFGITASDALAKLQIGKLDVKFKRSQIGVRGSVNRGDSSTLVDLEVPAASVDASDLASLAALAGVKSPLEFSSSRPVKLQARVQGDITHRQNLNMSGSLDVEDFTFKLPNMDKPMEQVRGRVTLRGDGFDVSGFSGVIGRSDVGGTMSVSDLSSPRATFALTSRHADFWELMSFLKEEPSASDKPRSAPVSSGGDDLLSHVTARGTLAIGEGSFGTLAFTGLTSTVALERKVMRLDPVSMKLYSGSMNGSASMDMNREPALYSVEVKADAIDTDAMLTANMQMKGMLTGALSGRFSVTSSGSTRDDALRNAHGSGDLRIEKGRIGALNVLKVLSRASDLMGEKSLKEVSGRLAKEGTEFSSLSATLDVGGGKIRSKNLSLVSPDIELTDDGAFDMLAGTIDVAGQIIFSDVLSQAMVQERSRAVDYFWDSQHGRVDLPIRMTGPVGSPSPNIDWGSVGGNLARRKVQDTLRDRLKNTGAGGLLGDLLGKQPERQPEPNQPKSPANAPPASGVLGITVEEKGFAGSALLPGLKIRGTLNGTIITAANARVTDSNGRLVYEQSLMQKVNKYYTNHERSIPAAIVFRVEVDGKQLLGSSGELTVNITIADASGGTAEKTVSVSR